MGVGEKEKRRIEREDKTHFLSNLFFLTLPPQRGVSHFLASEIHSLTPIQPISLSLIFKCSNHVMNGEYLPLLQGGEAEL